MLLYKDPTNHYLAVHPSLRFEAVAGFQVCNSGRPVPRPACEYIGEDEAAADSDEPKAAMVELLLRKAEG